MDNQRINHSNHRMYHSQTGRQNSNGEISGEYHRLDFVSKAQAVQGMGFINLYDLSYLFSGHSREMQRPRYSPGERCHRIAESNRTSCLVESSQVGSVQSFLLGRHQTSHITTTTEHSLQNTFRLGQCGLAPAGEPPALTACAGCSTGGSAAGCR